MEIITFLLMCIICATVAAHALSRKPQSPTQTPPDPDPEPIIIPAMPQTQQGFQGMRNEQTLDAYTFWYVINNLPKYQAYFSRQENLIRQGLIK